MAEDNQVRIAMRASDNEVQERIDRLNAKLEEMNTKLRDVGRTSKQSAQDSKEGFKEVESAFDGFVGKAAGAMAALFSTQKVLEWRDAYLKAIDEAGKAFTQRESDVARVSRGASLSVAGQEQLRSIIGGGESAFTTQERTQVFEAIAGELRPTTAAEERSALTIQTLLQRRGDALTAGEAAQIGAGAGGLARFGGLSAEQAVGQAALAYQRGGSANLVQQTSRLAGALAYATPGMAAEERSALLLSLGEQMDRAGVESGSLKGVFQRLAKFQGDGGAYSLNIGGEKVSGTADFLMGGSAFDAFGTLVRRAQSGDGVALALSNQLLGEQSGAILGALNMDAVLAGQRSYMGAGAGVIDDMQRRALSNPQVAADVARRRAEASVEQRAQYEAQQAGAFEADRARFFEEYVRREDLGWTGRQFLRADMAVARRLTGQAGLQGRIDEIRAGWAEEEAEAARRARNREAGRPEWYGSMAGFGQTERMPTFADAPVFGPPVVNVNISQDANGQVVDYSANYDSGDVR